jgi:hypothetical protein
VHRWIKARGGLVVKVHLDPRGFTDWCDERGIVMDAQARERFARETARRALTAGSATSAHAARLVQALK